MATQLKQDNSLLQLDVSRMEMWRDDAWRVPFQRLLNEAPVHYCADSIFGPYLLPFWALSFVLLVAVIGAIVLARKD